MIPRTSAHNPHSLGACPEDQPPGETGACAALLRLMAVEGARAVAEEGKIVVVAQRRSITMRIGSAAIGVAEALCSAGLACWGQAKGSRTVLALTSVGRAAASSMTLPEGMRRAVGANVLVHEPCAIADGGTVTVDLQESPLLWLHRRKGRDGRGWLGDAEFAAGERLRADMTTAAMMPRMTVSWENGPSSGYQAGLTVNDHVLAARQRVQRALAAVGPELSGILTDVCGFLKGIDAVERERGWPARSAKVVLLLALRRLAGHYGLSNIAEGPVRSRRRHMWGAADYRPAFAVAPDQAEA